MATPFNFPAAPTEGQVYTPAGGPQYVWRSPRWMIDGSGHITPSLTNTFDLGSATLRWRTIYTSDLSLNNGIGDWTIVEGADDLFLYNNRKGTVYRFALEEVDPATVPPKEV